MGPSQGTGELSVFFQILTSRKLMESEAHFSHGALTTSLQFCGHDGLFRHVKFKSCSFRQLTLFTKLVKHNLRKSCWQLDYNHLLSMGLSTHPFLTSWLTFVFLFSHAPADWPILKKWHWNEKIITPVFLQGTACKSTDTGRASKTWFDGRRSGKSLPRAMALPGSDVRMNEGTPELFCTVPPTLF